MLVERNFSFSITDKARKYIAARGKGAARLYINTHIHQGAGTVKINLTADAELGAPSEKLEEFDCQQNGDVCLYVHESVYKYADSNEGLIAFESGFLFTGLVFKKILVNNKR